MTIQSVCRRASALARGHGVKATALAGLLAQVGRPLVSLVTLPLLLSHLGQGGLGVWMVALSMMGLVTFISGGLSASVVTAIGRAYVDPTGERARRLTSAATLIAAFWGLIVLVVAVPAALLVDWVWLLGLGAKPSGEDVGKLMVVLAVMLAVGILAAVPRQVMFGRLHGYLAHALDFAGVVAGAIGLIFGLHFDAPLWLLGAAFLCPSVLTQFVGGLVYLARAGVPLCTRENVDWDTLQTLGRDSLQMAAYHGAYSVSSQSDLFLIALFLGAPASAAYGIAQRVFSLPILVAATVNHAQWPSLARVDAAGEHADVALLFGRTLTIGSGGATIAAAAFAFSYEPLIRAWLGRYVETDPLILAGMVAWVLVATLVTTCDTLLRARQETAFLMRWMIAMAAVNIVTTLLLLPRIGSAGAIWGSVIGYTVALLGPYSIRLWELIGTRKKVEDIGADAS